MTKNKVTNIVKRKQDALKFVLLFT